MTKYKDEKSSEELSDEKQKLDKDKSISKEILEWIVSIIVAVVLVMLLNTYISQVIKVYGHSMEPNLYTDERMLVRKINYNLDTAERGDVVITHYPDKSEYLVKRLIGLPGDILQALDGELYINGVMVEEPYIKETMLADFDEIIIPENHYFIMGDNRNNSSDSRSYSVGILPEDMLVGKVMLIVWPFDKIRIIDSHDYTELAS